MKKKMESRKKKVLGGRERARDINLSANANHLFVRKTAETTLCL